MNILGYISAILILIGIAFQSYYMGWFFDKKIHDNLKGYHKAYHEIEKKYINQKFDSIPKKREQRSIASNKESNFQSRVPHKKELTPCCMRLNLWNYRNADINNPENFRILEKLITLLYEDKIIDKKNILGFSKRLVMAIQAKKNSSVRLEQIKFNHSQDQEIFYNMLKGKKGVYPSLLNYVTFKSSENNPICIACADSIILTCLFNENIANTLTFYKNDPLEQIVIDENSFQKIISSYCIGKSHLPDFTLKHKKSHVGETIISAEEESTHIRLHQKMPSINRARKNS